MPKLTGLAGTIKVDNDSGVAKDIGGDVTNYEIATPRGLIDVTGMNKYANERLLGLTDLNITMTGVFDNTADMSHAVLSTFTQPGAQSGRTVSIAPTSNAATPKLDSECLITDYQVTRNDNAQLTWKSPFALFDGTVPTWA